LRRLEWNGSFRSAFGANGARLGSYAAGRAGSTLYLALLAAFGVVFELFIVKEELLSRGKNEVVSAIYAFKYFIDELHTPTLTLTGI
jgi:hypothetical protein